MTPTRSSGTKIHNGTNESTAAPKFMAFLQCRWAAVSPTPVLVFKDYELALEIAARHCRFIGPVSSYDCKRTQPCCSRLPATRIHPNPWPGTPESRYLVSNAIGTPPALRPRALAGYRRRVVLGFKCCMSARSNCGPTGPLHRSISSIERSQTCPSQVSNQARWTSAGSVRRASRKTPHCPRPSHEARRSASSAARRLTRKTPESGRGLAALRGCASPTQRLRHAP